MPRFEPFRGLRYDPEGVDISAVLAPPYDVIDAEQWARLTARSPYNAAQVELPHDEAGASRYEVACRLLRRWQDERVLVLDDEPAFYVYRMGYRDERGGLRQTSGVIGALALSAPGEGGILPHEHTTPKAKSDRLDMLRSCRANLSPIWGLSPAEGLSALCELPGPPVARGTDELGVHHRLWRVDAPGVVEALSAAVASAPVVVADGHHRYETALAYRDERRATDGPGPWDAVMAFVVELSADQLAVGAIHRLLSGLPDDLDLLEALAPFFDAFPTDRPDEAATARLADAGALALVRPDGAWLLRPRAGAFDDGVRDLDTSRLDAALATLPPHRVAFQHGVGHVVRAVERGEAQAGVLLRPASVDQIAATASGGERMPPKTTYFFPKPATGLVFRPLG